MTNLYETINYKGYKISIYYEEAPHNPCNDDYGYNPMLISYGRNDERDYSKQDDLRDPMAYLSDSIMTRKWRDIVKACEIDTSEYNDYKANGYSAIEAKRETLANAELSFDALAYLWNMAGYAALSTSKKGYSQGDYFYALIVQSPEWLKSVGLPKLTRHNIEERERYMQASVDLYAAYVFGDCYYYVINNDDADSCGGFFGNDHEKSGLLEYAQSDIDYQVSSDQARHNEVIASSYDEITYALIQHFK